VRVQVSPVNIAGHLTLRRRTRIGRTRTTACIAHVVNAAVSAIQDGRAGRAVAHARVLGARSTLDIAGAKERPDGCDCDKSDAAGHRRC